MADERPEIVVPEEAANRGHILKGELRSNDRNIAGILAQFSKLTPHKKTASVYFYTTLEQARLLFEARSPFSFEGTRSLDEHTKTRYRSSEIWLNYGSQITSKEMHCFTQCSGRPVDLQIINEPEDEVKGIGGSAWFVTRGCYALWLLAASLEYEEIIAKRHKIERIPHKFELSGGSIAEIERITAGQNLKRDKEIKKRAYAIKVNNVKNADAVKRDVEGLLILASLASRERSDFGYWSVGETTGRNTQNWRFGMGKWLKRPDGMEPLLRGEETCRDFLSASLKRYLASSRMNLVDSAVYALMAHDLPIETRIVRLFSGVQSALLFASPDSDKRGRPKIETLFRHFQKSNSVDLSDLWPLFGKKQDCPLSAIRHAIVHGEVFAQKDFLSLSIAAENLQWTLERILLVALGWNVETSAVSPTQLRLYIAHDWIDMKRSLKI